VKTSELAEMTVSELSHKLAELRRKLLETRFASALNQLKNPLTLRHLRRSVARVLTLIRQKEMAHGK
jgi:large subunit ribosomal protein L29